MISRDRVVRRIAENTGRKERGTVKKKKKRRRGGDFNNWNAQKN